MIEGTATVAFTANYEWKAEVYTTVNGLESGLATEVAAGWEPHVANNFPTTLSSNQMAVIYRRAL